MQPQNLIIEIMKEILCNQYKNLFLWSPFVIACGAVLYFSLNTEPNFHFPILITILSGLIIYKHKNIITTAIALFIFGFFYSMSFTQIINTPQIYKSYKTYNISGVVNDVDFMPNLTRISVKIPANQIDNSFSSNKYTNIRFSLNNNSQIPNVNDKISGHALIFHPSAAYLPDDFDFARWSYFNKLSGTGIFKDYAITPTQSTLAQTRTNIHKKANSVLTDALVLGYKNTLPEQEHNIWQSVGVGHIWSISGFHMTLVGGWLFALFYLLFRCIAPITKRIPAKYPAMICAWCGLLFYLFISGLGVATMRAFLMTTLIFAAAIFGRNILSLRNAALVFIVLFLINPFYIVSAGFQLSFAAMFGLLWFFNNKKYVKRNFIKRILYGFYALLMTAIIAGVFTLPFIMAHFGYIPIYSLIGNIIILPIFSALIMPIVMIGTICACFGYHCLLDVTDGIYTFAFELAKGITNLPYATISVPHISIYVLGLFILGLVCIMFIVPSESGNVIKRNINYFIGIIFIICAILLIQDTSKPLFYSTYDNALVGFVEKGKIQFNRNKMSKHFFAFNAWRQFNNESIQDKINRKKCPKGLCIYKTQNWNLVYMQTIKTIMDNINTICRDKSVDYIVTPFEIHAPNCHAKVLSGGMVIYPNGKVTKISNHRPWHKGL